MKVMFHTGKDGTVTLDCGDCETKTEYTPLPGESFSTQQALLLHVHEAHAKATSASKGACDASVLEAP